MDVVNSIIDNKFLASSVCFIGGYALNSTLLAANQFAAKSLGLPIDIMGGKEHDEFTYDLIQANDNLRQLNGAELDRQLGVILADFTVISIREEISFRFLIETVVLPRICPQFAAFSIARTSISSLWFSASHLSDNFPGEALAGQLLNTALLGAVCSLAQQKIGLTGSILVHVGFNFYAWQWSYKQNLSDVATKIQAIQLIDVFHPVKISMNVLSLSVEAISCATLILASQGVKRLVNSFS